MHIFPDSSDEASSIDVIGYIICFYPHYKYVICSLKDTDNLSSIILIKDNDFLLFAS